MLISLLFQFYGMGQRGKAVIGCLREPSIACFRGRVHAAAFPFGLGYKINLNPYLIANHLLALRKHCLCGVIKESINFAIKQSGSLWSQASFEALGKLAG